MPRPRRLTGSGGVPLTRRPPESRPRERLRALGPGALSDREHLSILIGAGMPGRTALEVGDGVLAMGRGSLRRLGGMEPALLERVPGVGAAASSRILSALELGRRAVREGPELRTPIRGPSDVFRRMGPRLRDLRFEEFHALLLNAQHAVLREALITRGILDASLIHPREVFRPAIVEAASGVILVHNHPSGDPTPSHEDRVVTRQLARAGEAIGIAVLDHVIIGDGSFHSMAGSGGLA